MKSYKNMSKEELLTLRNELIKEYDASRELGMSLNMARGKPSMEQLNLSMDMFDVFSSKINPISESGVDIRNYGELTGIPEAKKLMGDILEVPAENIIICGNSALNIMYDTVSKSMNFGVCGSTPWCRLENVKFLCPAPGYDRHFAITELFGIEMITIPIGEEGPDMEQVKQYVENDPAVKGIWCVPKYSNPQGIVYSDRVVQEMAALKPAAEDFRIFWDNAYAVHDLYENSPKLLNIFDECRKNGRENMVYEFASTSKICFAGGGIAAIAASKTNLEWFKKSMTVQTIGFDKINQYRHVCYFKNIEGIRKKMKEHADILRPKFELVVNYLEQELSGLDIASFIKPKGGYFISFQALPGTAKKIVELCNGAGLVMTPAGAAFPYGKDPEDSNIRIAPSFPTNEEMEAAVKLFVLCVKLAAADKLLEDK